MTMPEQALRDMLCGESGDALTYGKCYMVEAGAGAGKTYTLQHRIVRQLLLGQCEPENLVSITFTNKATQELRQRIDKGVRDALKDAPDKSLALRAARMQVSTIHSFCSKLLTTQPFYSPLGFELQPADEAAAGAFFERRWRQDPALFSAAKRRFGLRMDEARDFFLSCAKTPDAALARVSPDDRQGTAALETALRTAALEWFGKLAAIRDVYEADALLVLPELRALLKCTEAEFSADADKADALARICLRYSAPVSNERADLTLYYAVRNKTKDGKPERIEELSAEERAYFDAHPLLKRYGSAEAAWKAGDALRAAAAKLNHALCAPDVLRLLEEYRQEKLDAHLASFDDLLVYARDMLRDEPRAREYFHARYRVLYVDEFQDTDVVQTQLLFFLTATPESFDPTDWRKCVPEPGSLFLVGDPKQAIYRFRGADIDTYEAVKERFVRDGIGEFVQLRFNYRSTEGVCRLTETVFKEKEDADGGKAAKGGKKHEFDKTLCGKPYQAAFSPMESMAGASKYERLVSYDALGAGSDDRKRFDAEQVAAFIRTMVGRKLPVGRDGHPHPARYGDFLILPWGKRSVNDYMRALDALGIPCNIAGTERFSETEPIRRGVLHLRSVCAPNDALALYAVLETCYGATRETLRRLLQRSGCGLTQLVYPDRLYPVLRALREEKDAALLPLAEAFAELADLRAAAQRESAMSVIERLFDGGYGLYDPALPLRERRAQYARTRQFLDELRKSPEHSFPALAAWAAERAEAEIEQQLALRRSTDCVRIMNLHKSKGLEGEIVILPYAAAPRAGSSDRVHVRDDRTAYVRFSSPSQTYSRWIGLPPCPDGFDPWTEEANYQKAEKVRLRYVAATRAASMLIVSAAWSLPPKPDKDGKPGKAKEGAWSDAELALLDGARADEIRARKRTSATAWQSIGDACVHANASDALYGEAFRALISGVSAVAADTEEDAAAVAVSPAALEAQIRETAARLAAPSAALLNPSRFDPAVSRAVPSRATVADGEEDEKAPESEAETGTAPRPAADAPSGTDWGTLVHRVAEMAVRSGRRSADDLVGFAKTAVAETLDGESTEALRALLHDDGAERAEALARLAERAAQSLSFLSDPDAPLCRLLDGAERYTELPFVLCEQPDGALYKTLAEWLGGVTDGRRIEAQGVIDLALLHGEGWCVIDYKTNRLRDGETEAAFCERLRAHYAPQLSVYAAVLNEMEQRRGGQSRVYRTALCATALGGRLIDIPL